MFDNFVCTMYADFTGGGFREAKSGNQPGEMPPGIDREVYSISADIAECVASVLSHKGVLALARAIVILLTNGDSRLCADAPCFDALHDACDAFAEQQNAGMRVDK